MPWYFNRVVFDPKRLITNYIRVRVFRAGTNLQELCAHGHAVFLKLGKCAVLILRLLMHAVVRDA